MVLRRLGPYQPKTPKKRPVKKGRREGADDDLEMDPVPKGKMKPPEPEGPPLNKSHLTEVVFTFKDGSGAVVRRMFNELTPRQRTRVQKALAKAPWREKRQRTTSVQREQRPTVNRQSELSAPRFLRIGFAAEAWRSNSRLQGDSVSEWGFGKG